MDIQKAFGQKVQQLRKEKGLSQEKFALSIDMDRTYFASVEAGKRNIAIKKHSENCRWPRRFSE